MTLTEQNTSLLGLTIKDLQRIRKVSAPLWSPDGIYFVYHLMLSDSCTDSYIDLIVLKAIGSSTKTIIGRGVAYAWSPDGKQLLYETENKELAIYTLQTEKSRNLTQRYESSYFINHLTLNNCSWSPDGKYIAYVSSDMSLTQQPAVRVINDLLYKSKGGRSRPIYADRARTHIYLIQAVGGEPEPLTVGVYDEHSITWSPDGRYIAFISNRAGQPDDQHQSDVFKVDIHSKEITKLTRHEGLSYQPAWSPDGRYIAFLATSEPVGTNDSPAEDTHIALVPVEGGSFRYCTKSLDRRIEHIRWHPSGTHIYFTAGNHGDTSIYRTNIDTGCIEIVRGGAGCISEFCLDTEGENMLFVKSGASQPAEIFQTKDGDAETEPVSQENDSWLGTKKLQQAETFWFESFDTTPVQGWLLPPVGFEPTGSYPLILVIHGGPHNMFGQDFDGRMHLLSQAGYAVIYINPRGSHGYGQVFSRGTINSWGGGDYLDLMAGIDFVLGQNTWLDAERMGVTGQSYGGFMTNWIITQTTRFKAAVTDGGLSNLISFAGTSLYHSLMESEFGGRAHDRFDLLWEWSPLRMVAQVTTPTLLLHGETDNEVPFSQAEEMYIALKKKGVSTQLVQYTGEGHGWRPELSPRNLVDLSERMIRWFDTYIKKINNEQEK